MSKSHKLCETVKDLYRDRAEIDSFLRDPANINEVQNLIMRTRFPKGDRRFMCSVYGLMGQKEMTIEELSVSENIPMEEIHNRIEGILDQLLIARIAQIEPLEYQYA